MKNGRLWQSSFVSIGFSCWRRLACCMLCGLPPVYPLYLYVPGEQCPVLRYDTLLTGHARTEDLQVDVRRAPGELCF